MQCDDNEQAYLKVLMDEVFGRENFVANLVWHKKNVVQNDVKYFNGNHDHILVFCKVKDNWKPNLLKRTEEMNARYSNPDKDPRGEWTSVALQAKSGTKNNLYEIEFPNGIKWKPVDGTYPRLNKKSLEQAYDENRLWFGKTGKNIPRLKKYLSEVKQGLVSNTIFSNEYSGSTQQGKEELKRILNKNIFTTPKPERLLQRIIEITTKPGDIVLDFCLGSGTTCAVAHKMGRQYIGIEQMDYIESIAVERLTKVIDGEQGGISKAVQWQSGGDFVYCELKKHNQAFIDRITTATTTEELIAIKADILSHIDIDYRLDTEAVAQSTEDFALLTLEQQQNILIDFLELNQLYVPYTERKDTRFACTDQEIQVSEAFCKGGTT